MVKRDRTKGATAPDDDEDALSTFAAAMRRRGRPVRVIDFPGVPGLRVGLWCPTEGEESEADVESRKYLTKTLGLNALELSLSQETELAKREREIELLAAILRNAEDPGQSFADSADDLREHLEKEQRVALMATVADFKRDRFASGTPEESAEIVRLAQSLKAVGAVATYWMSCDFDTQVRVVHALIEAIPSRTAPTSSDT